MENTTMCPCCQHVKLPLEVIDATDIDEGFEAEFACGSILHKQYGISQSAHCKTRETMFRYRIKIQKQSELIAAQQKIIDDLLLKNKESLDSIKKILDSNPS